MLPVPNFKAFVMADAAAFLNPNEFGELHVIDGIEMLVVVDADQEGRGIPNAQGEQPPSYAEGVSLWRMILYVDVLTLGYRPAENQRMNFDGEIMTVAGVSEQDGMYMIVLERNLG